MGLQSLTQESLLCLLLHDAENGGRVASLVPIDVWDNVYRRVAERCYDYWAQYKIPPAEHAVDIFDDLAREDKGKKDEVKRLWKSIQESRAGINAKYVLGQVSKFLREQRIRAGIIESSELVSMGRIDEAEQAIQQSIKGVLDVFEPGLVFHELDVRELLSEDRQPLPTGIKLLDERGLGPAAGELSLFIAPPGYGKSWWLIHLAKWAMAYGRKVVYVTLEMSEKRVAQRFLQTLCNVAKRREALYNKVFRENELGQMIGLDAKRVSGLKTFADDDIEALLTKRLKKFETRSPLVIKQFPTGALTVRELIGYLDNLEMSRRIVPDLLLVDYADLMSIGSHDYRHELGNLYKDLRGLAVSRNVALATASQSNRATIEYSKVAKTITGAGVAEDFSKMATCDTVFTYNRTEAEQAIDTARLWVEKGRNEADKFMVLMTQNYKTGQFCLSSTRMLSSRYWETVNAGKTEAAPRTRNKLPRKRERL